MGKVAGSSGGMSTGAVSFSQVTIGGVVVGQSGVVGDNNVNYQITAAQSGYTFYDTAGAGTMVYLLPSAAAGLVYTFIRSSTADNFLDVKAAAGDTISHRNLTTAAAGTIRATSVYSAITVVALDATRWVAIRSEGEWLADGSTPEPGDGVTSAETLLKFEGSVTGQATRPLQANYEGACYLVHRSVRFNRLLLRITTGGAAGTGSIHLFQASGGGDGVATRVATFTNFDASAVATLELTPSEGTVLLAPGRVFALVGLSGGVAGTLRTYAGTGTCDLLNANVDEDTHPIAFTTTVAGTTTPATFDPRQAPTGAATATTASIVPVLRVRRV